MAWKIKQKNPLFLIIIVTRISKVCEVKLDFRTDTKIRKNKPIKS